jgi:hypothetical protein
MRNYGGNVRAQVLEEELAVKKKQWVGLGTLVLGVVMLAVQPVGAQTQAPSVPQDMASPPAPAAASTPYLPKFAGDPARSDSEAQALGYMRVVLRAQREYKKRHDKFAESLPALAGTGSLTKRMARSNERGDYTVGFHSQKDGFILTMTPKQMDSEHRSFYAEEDAIIHADDQKAADQNSPKIK